MQTPSAHSRKATGAPLGLRLPPASLPAVAWSPWQVVDREHGFHVSRESGSGASVDFLRNEVREVKIFRKRELALAACAKAKGGAA